jgi:hypothetical protein
MVAVSVEEKPINQFTIEKDTDEEERTQTSFVIE